MPDYFCHPLSCAQQVPQLEGNIIEESQAGFWYWCWSCCSWSTKYRRSLELSIWSFRSPRLVFGAGAEAAATGQQQYRRSLELRISSFRRRGEWFLREKKTGPWQCCANSYWTPIPKFHFDNFARFEDLKKQIGNSLFSSKSLILSSDCEQMWVICSFHSFKKSNCKQIILVALNKRATVSDSLRSVMKKEQPWSNHSWFL